MTEQHEGYFRFIGVAIAMAVADNELDPSEIELIEYVCEEVGLPDALRSEVEKMYKTPPSEAQIAAWTANDDDRVAVYAMALLVAHADRKLMLKEKQMLERLRSFLKLSDEQVATAEAQMADASL
jgi:uncharacterized membrane protein YebE (DUF533 family)